MWWCSATLNSHKVYGSSSSNNNNNVCYSVSHVYHDARIVSRLFILYGVQCVRTLNTDWTLHTKPVPWTAHTANTYNRCPPTRMVLTLAFLPNIIRSSMVVVCCSNKIHSISAPMLNQTHYRIKIDEHGRKVYVYIAVYLLYSKALCVWMDALKWCAGFRILSQCML